MEKALKKFEEFSRRLQENKITLKQYTRAIKVINIIMKKELGY